MARESGHEGSYMRLLLRRFATWLFVGLLSALVFGVIGQWAIQVATDKGLYTDAGKNWDRGMMALAHFFHGLVALATSTPVLMLLAASGGGALALSVDKKLKVSEGGSNAPYPDAPIKNEGAKRKFLGSNIDPIFLISHFKGRTNLEAKNITEKYIGKWIKAKGYLVDIFSYDDNSLNVFVEFPNYIELIPEHSAYHPINIRGHFTKDYEELNTRRKGDVLIFNGRISRISGNSVELDDCELIAAMTVEEIKAANPAPQSPPDTEPETPQ